MADSSLLSHSCSSLRLPDMLTVTPQYSTACVMFGNCAKVERRRSGGQSEREKRAEGFPAHGRQDLRLTSRSSNRDGSGTNGCLRKESLPYPQVMIILTLSTVDPQLAQSSHKGSIFSTIKVSRSRGRSTIRVVVRGLVS